jgi:hypothetical protein
VPLLDSRPEDENLVHFSFPIHERDFR